MAGPNRKLMSEINVVPYIDVMLVLLIIFMVTVPLIQQGVEVDLPEAPAKTMDPSEVPDPLIVTVDGVGRIYVNKGEAAGRALSPQGLIEQAEVLLPGVGGEVYVRGDHQAEYGNVVSAMVILQNAGADSIGLITRSPEQ